MKGPEGDALWTQYLHCRLWSMPPDNRIDLSFQKHVLKSIPVEHAENTVKSLKQWLDSSPHLVTVHNVGIADKSVHYEHSYDAEAVESQLYFLQGIGLQYGRLPPFISMEGAKSHPESAPWRRFM